MGFRFIHADQADGRNFLPVAKINPRRKFHNAKECCSAHALSMLVTDTAGRAFYALMMAKFKQLHLAVGTHIATGMLNHAHGGATTPRPDGHFDFFEAAGVDLAEVFTHAEEIACDAAS